MKYTREQIEKAIDTVSSKILTGNLNYKGYSFTEWVVEELEKQEQQKPTLNDHPNADNIRAWAKHLKWSGDIDEAMSTKVFPERWPIPHPVQAFNSKHPGAIIHHYYSGHRKAGRLLEFLFDNGVKDLSIAPPEPRTKQEQSIDNHYKMMGLDCGPVYLYEYGETKWSVHLVQHADKTKLHKWIVGKTKLEDLKCQ